MTRTVKMAYWKEIFEPILLILCLANVGECSGNADGKIEVTLFLRDSTVDVMCISDKSANLQDLNKTLEEYQKASITVMLVSFCNSTEEVLQIFSKFGLLEGNNHTSTERAQFNLNLTALGLVGNKIKHVPGDTFAKLIRLEEINLKRNSIGKLEGNVFAHNKAIYRITLDDNPALELTNEIFANLPRLTVISINSCNLKSIPEDAFANSTSIGWLYLEHNLLETLPDLTMLTDLREIDLENNRFKEIPKFPDIPLSSLDMTFNLIEEIPANIFENLGSNIKYVNLYGNRIRRIDPDAFLPNDGLLTVDLRENDYQPEMPLNYIFRTSKYALRQLSLANNSIRSFAHLHPDKLFSLAELDLRMNFIKTITFYDSFMFRRHPLRIYLDSNNITHIYFDAVEYKEQNPKKGTRSAVTTYVRDNPLRCDCHNYDFITHFTSPLKHYELLRVDAENVHCDSPLPIAATRQFLNCSLEELNGTCPQGCKCIWRPFTQSLQYDCAYSNLTEIPELPDQPIGDTVKETEVLLQGNLLKEGPSSDRNRGWNNVTKADLSHNRIEVFSWVPSKIEMLNLANNSIRSLPRDALEKLEEVDSLRLEENPWNCDCTALDFVAFIHRHSMKNVTCGSSGEEVMHLTELDLCFQPLSVILAVTAVLLIAATFSALFYKYEEEILIWLWSNGIDFCCLQPEEELDKRKKFDAFISYAHQDSGFVLDVLLPVLESGPKPYKLCVHDRDWPAAGMIIEQIVKSVSAARRTVVVLSTNFMESVWGRMEFRAAHRQAMADRRNRIVVVVLGDFDLDGVDDEFKTYLRTNTYIKWKENDSWFWTKLKYSLPHPRRRRCCRGGDAASPADDDIALA